MRCSSSHVTIESSDIVEYHRIQITHQIQIKDHRRFTVVTEKGKQYTIHHMVTVEDTSSASIRLTRSSNSTRSRQVTEPSRAVKVCQGSMDCCSVSSKCVYIHLVRRFLGSSLPNGVVPYLLSRVRLREVVVISRDTETCSIMSKLTSDMQLSNKTVGGEGVDDDSSQGPAHGSGTTSAEESRAEQVVNQVQIPRIKFLLHLPNRLRIRQSWRKYQVNHVLKKLVQ
jgi:hypothetical protein